MLWLPALLLAQHEVIFATSRLFRTSDDGIYFRPILKLTVVILAIGSNEERSGLQWRGSRPNFSDVGLRSRCARWVDIGKPRARHGSGV